MPAPAIRASSLPLSRLLDIATAHGSLALALRAHARVHLLGLSGDPFIASKLASAYSLLDRRSFSLLLPHSDLLLSNSLLAARLRADLFHELLSLFHQLHPSLSPDNYTLAIVSKAAAEIRDSSTGRVIHSMAVKLGFCWDPVLSNSLMGLYFKCGVPGDARKLFDGMPVRSVASWNSLIQELVNLGYCKAAVMKLVTRMQEDGMKPDAFTISTILPLCGVSFGKQVHGFVLRHGLDSDFHVGSCLIGMYSRSKSVSLGRQVFDQMVFRNVVIWTAMITGYVDNGDCEEALELFRSMQTRDGIVPNKITLVSVLPAVGSLASLLLGKQIHSFAFRVRLKNEVSLNNAIIDMYSKCGSLDYAKRVFDDKSWHKDIVSWSSMVSCYGIHGMGEEALFLFNSISILGMKLDHITGLGILSACGKAGLVAEGSKIYSSLVNDHLFIPTMEIYSCMVDMLGRAGQLNEALDFISSMPLPPSPSVWGALFNASVIHNNLEMQDLAYRSLLEIASDNPSNYVSLSNVHAFSERWDSVAELRTRMKEKGLRKIPGCSWINVDSRMYSFYVADKSHQSSDMIYSVLRNLSLAMRGANYEANLNCLTNY